MKKIQNISDKILTYIILIFFGLTVVVPYAWVFSNAFRLNNEIGKFTGLGVYTFIPQHFTLSNFSRMFQQLNFSQIMFNTVLVTLVVTIGSLLLDSMAAYSFARINFKGKNVIFIILIATLIVPMEVLIIPLYVTIRDIGLMNKLSSLIIPFMANAFGIFFMRQFYADLPRELEEAALIDGCGRFKMFFKIFLPISKTPMVTLGLLTFLQQWDSFMVPVTLINDKAKMVLQVALTYLSMGLYEKDYGIIFAGVVFAVIPILILFLFLQQYIIESVVSTGIKG